MASAGRRVKGLEFAISICLLAILFLIAVGVFIKQSDFDMKRFGISPATAELSLEQLEVHTLQVSEQEKPALSSLVPAGFEALLKTEVYKPESLYEKINGKAPLYIESGFEELSTQRFAKTDDQGLWMELFVYDMGNVKNAFSVYSIQRRAEGKAFSPMRFAYKTSNALYFVHGKYYIELVGSAESDELFRAISEVARKIRANLAIDYDTEIAELQFFPQENLVSGSIKLYLANAFGFRGLTNTFSARYTIADETVTAFLSKQANSNDAKKMAESYRGFLIENGAAKKETSQKSIEGKVMDFYGTTEIVFTVGRFVAGVHEAENQQAAEKIAEMLTNKLNSVVSNE